MLATQEQCDVLLSHRKSTLSSALTGFTSELEMGSGGSHVARILLYQCKGRDYTTATLDTTARDNEAVNLRLALPQRVFKVPL